MVVVRSLYGLRGIRERPRTQVPRRGVVVCSSPDPTDSDRTAFLDGFEQDLCPIVPERRGTQLAPTMI